MKGKSCKRFNPYQRNEAVIKEVETNENRLSLRQRQIDMGKTTIGYKRYVAEVKRKERTKDHPWTPSKFTVCSTRSWQGVYRIWRRKLHFWDPPEEESEVEVPKKDGIADKMFGDIADEILNDSNKRNNAENENDVDNFFSSNQGLVRPNIGDRNLGRTILNDRVNQHHEITLRNIFKTDPPGQKNLCYQRKYETSKEVNNLQQQSIYNSAMYSLINNTNGTHSSPDLSKKDQESNKLSIYNTTYSLIQNVKESQHAQFVYERRYNAVRGLNDSQEQSKHFLKFGLDKDINDNQSHSQHIYSTKYSFDKSNFGLANQYDFYKSSYIWK